MDGATPFPRNFHVVFDVASCFLNLSIIHQGVLQVKWFIRCTIQNYQTVLVIHDSNIDIAQQNVELYINNIK